MEELKKIEEYEAIKKEENKKYKEVILKLHKEKMADILLPDIREEGVSRLLQILQKKIIIY